MTIKVFIHIAVTESRLNDPFLRPVHDSFAALYYDAERIGVFAILNQDTRKFVTHTYLYADSVEHASQQAQSENYDWLMLLDDDEQLPRNAIQLFLEAAKATGGHFFTASKRERMNTRGRGPGESWEPKAWHFLEPHVINSRLMRVEPIRPPATPTLEIEAGTICTPAFMDLHWIREHDLKFHGEPGIGEFAGAWDSPLSRDLYEKYHEPFYVVRDVTVKHFCIDTHNVYA